VKIVSVQHKKLYIFCLFAGALSILFANCSEAYYDSKSKTYTYKIVGATPETTRFVREVLRELEVKKPDEIFVAGDGSSLVPELHLKKDKFNNPRYIQFDEKALDGLSDCEKRFVVVLGIMTALRTDRLASTKIKAMISTVLSIPGFDRLAIFVCILVPMLVYFKLEGHYSLGTISVAGCSFGLVSLLIAAWRSRRFAREVDIDAALFSGDLDGIVQYVRRQKKEDEKDCFQTTIAGGLERLFFMIAKPLSFSVWPDVRLRYMRQLARKQARESAEQDAALQDKEDGELALA